MNDFSQLKNHFIRLYKGFLVQHISAQTFTPSIQEEDSVKAFCVLSHAALEEYFEKIASKTIKNSYKKYKSKTLIDKMPANQSEVDEINKNIFQLINTLVLCSAYAIYSKSTSDVFKTHKSKLEQASLIHKNASPLTLQNVAELTKKTDSYTKEVLKEAVVFFDNYVGNNHGASLKYLLRLLIPVGLDIPGNLSLLNSLQKIAEYRGAYAHTKGNLIVILSASDIAKYAEDALELCKVISDSIKGFHNFTD